MTSVASLEFTTLHYNDQLRSHCWQRWRPKSKYVCIKWRKYSPDEAFPIGSASGVHWTVSYHKLIRVNSFVNALLW